MYLTPSVFIRVKFIVTSKICNIDYITPNIVDFFQSMYNFIILQQFWHSVLYYVLRYSKLVIFTEYYINYFMLLIN